MPTSLPPVSLWEQFYVVGIIVIVVALLAYAVWRVFKEYRIWQSEEANKARQWQEDQSKIQREWQTEQNQIRDAEQQKRDERWQEQVRTMTANSIEQDRSTANVMTKVLERMDALTVVLTLHDERAKDFIKESKK